MVVYPLMEQPCVKAGLLLKLREKRPVTVVGRGPKGWVCTGTHTGHTGRDGCSKMCAFTPTQSLIHSLLHVRSDRIDGPRGSISLHTSTEGS